MRKYEDILKDGERTDWYETQVPRELITGTVSLYVEGILKAINESESEVVGLRAGKEKTSKLNYIRAMWGNVRNAPYSLNGDFYLIKKKKFDDETVEKPKPKKRVTRKRTVTPKVVEGTPAKKLTKNQELIFGKKL